MKHNKVNVVLLILAMQSSLFAHAGPRMQHLTAKWQNRVLRETNVDPITGKRMSLDHPARVEYREFIDSERVSVRTILKGENQAIRQWTSFADPSIRNLMVYQEGGSRYFFRPEHGTLKSYDVEAKVFTFDVPVTLEPNGEVFGYYTIGIKLDQFGHGKGNPIEFGGPSLFQRVNDHIVSVEKLEN